MLLTLTDTESMTFYESISAELRSCVNEYDSDTGRCPSKKRIKDSQYAKSILEKWENTQTKIPNKTFINLDNIIGCSIDLTDKEKTYCKSLLEKQNKNYNKELAHYPKPYVGIMATIKKYADTTANIINRL